jgi:MFS family permease
MWLQAVAIAGVAAVHEFPAFAVSAVALGAGTAMVYPTLLAAIGDVVHPSKRASAVGSYRLWRDLGYAAGAAIAGGTADLFGVNTAVALVAAITLLSGVIVALRFSEGGPGARTVEAHTAANGTSARSYRGVVWRPRRIIP